MTMPTDRNPTLPSWLHAAAVETGELLGFALAPRLRPAPNTRYAQLLASYRDDPVRRQLLTAVADGLDTAVIDAGPLGLVLAPRNSSVLAAVSSRHTAAQEPARRAIIGLVHAALIARVADSHPGPDPVGDPASVTVVTVVDLDRELRAFLPADAPAGSAAATYQLMPAVVVPARGRGSGRRSPDCTTYWVAHVLDWLVEAGQARRLDAPDTFALTARFRILAATAATEAIAALRSQQLIPPSETPATPASSGDTL